MRGATRRKAPEFLTSVGSGLALVDDDDDYSTPSWGAPPITTTIVTVVAIVANVVTVVAIVAIVAIVTTPHPRSRRSRRIESGSLVISVGCVQHAGDPGSIPGEEVKIWSRIELFFVV